MVSHVHTYESAAVYTDKECGTTVVHVKRRIRCHWRRSPAEFIQCAPLELSMFRRAATTLHHAPPRATIRASPRNNIRHHISYRRRTRPLIVSTIDCFRLNKNHSRINNTSIIRHIGLVLELEKNEE